MRKFLLFVLLIFLSSIVQATHIRAGEITYKWLYGYTYEVTIVIYSKTSSAIEDAVLNDVQWGDGKSENFTKTSEVDYPGINTSKRMYIRQHTYPGPGAYRISLTHRNRNQGIQNIGNSVEAAFYLETTLIINPFNPVGESLLNNSPVLLNPPLDDACLNAVFEHNPAAHDPDGDRLEYSLIASRGENGTPLIYNFPDEINPGSNNTLTINQATGDIVWDSPQQLGEYNIAILIREYRGTELVGTVVRDMQINVTTCSNLPPITDILPDTCVEAITKITDSIFAIDPNPGELVKLTALGGPFSVTESPAVFTAAPESNPGRALFEWQTTCTHVRKEPYQVNIKARDNNSRPLADYESFLIKVVGPEVENLGAIPLGNAIRVSWQPSVCWNVVAYDIYRRDSYYGYFPPHCVTGVPGFTGYKFIGRVDGQESNNFLDTNITVGNEYCYMIVCIFPDGAESYPSREVCTLARLDMPQLIKVSVGRTDQVNGIDTVAWVNPYALDSLVRFKGPYQYKIFRDSMYGPATTLIHTTPLSNQLYLTDSVFIDTNVNTVAHANTYRVELYSNNQLAASSSTASSVFLTVTPQDRENILRWYYAVPWRNNFFDIYRYDNITSQYEFLITRLGQDSVYRDTALLNGQQYCYYIVSRGQYEQPRLPRPIINYSQQVCATPKDEKPPCNTTLNVTPDCDNAFAILIWDTVTRFCNADLMHYNIYYAPKRNETLQRIHQINRVTNQYIFNNKGSIAGCYAISVTDSLGNESELSPPQCIDNCEVPYVLPDVFSPNGDKINDLFHPFPYKYITTVDARIYNRWGKLVFSTTNPDINWDGKADGKPVVDGVYFYEVSYRRLTLDGEVERSVKGTVTVFTSLKDK